MGIQDELALLRDFLCLADVYDESVKNEIKEEITEEASILRSFLTLEDLPSMVDESDLQMLGVNATLNSVNDDEDDDANKNNGNSNDNNQKNVVVAAKNVNTQSAPIVAAQGDNYDPPVQILVSGRNVTIQKEEGRDDFDQTAEGDRGGESLEDAVPRPPTGYTPVVAPADPPAPVKNSRSVVARSATQSRQQQQRRHQPSPTPPCDEIVMRRENGLNKAVDDSAVPATNTYGSGDSSSAEEGSSVRIINKTLAAKTKAVTRKVSPERLRDGLRTLRGRSEINPRSNINNNHRNKNRASRSASPSSRVMIVVVRRDQKNNSMGLGMIR